MPSSCALAIVICFYRSSTNITISRKQHTLCVEQQENNIIHPEQCLFPIFSPVKEAEISVLAGMLLSNCLRAS